MFIERKIDGQDVDVWPILGAIGWPAGEEPGYAVVIGKSVSPRVASREYDYYLLSEAQATTSTMVIEQCVKWVRKLPELEFVHKYAPENARIVDAWNNNNQGPDFLVYQAPFSYERVISYPVENLYSLARFGCLYNFEGSVALEHMNAFQVNQISEATAAKYPVMAALGYAVLALKQFRNDDIPMGYPVHDTRYETVVDRITGY